ncbi:hypothetical protein PIB30_086420 [Stylosanthes scabra]|uniref:Uncharacterized protein n=1 Tax=Stylosanthes scabra TaxID=79078 RepID=A0ABU6QTP0_9FABA|nr:hypothetical protein [Stylosanthes scabra]
MNKTPEEAWELIESVADNNQHFKTRATSAAKGVFEVIPSESTILAKSLTDIASMLKEITEGHRAAPKALTQQSNSSQQRYQPPHNRQSYHTNLLVNSFPPSYEEALRTFQQENKEMREAQKRTETQLTNLIELLTKFTNQITINPPTPSQPSSSNPLPSQPLPNPMGGINMARREKGEEDERETGDDWLLELISELAKLDDSDEEESDGDESDEEEEDEEKEDE